MGWEDLEDPSYFTPYHEKGHLPPDQAVQSPVLLAITDIIKALMISGFPP